jgi:hypothetical protein
MVAVEDQVADLNAHARAMARAAARRKSIGLVEANNPDLGDKLTNAEDGEILPVKGLTGNHVVIELGGVTQDQYAYTEYARQRLDRISGLTATVQGNVGKANTATEAKIADDALSNRVLFLRNRIKKADEASMWRTCWWLFHTEGIVIPVNRRDPYTGEMLEGLFFGGPSPTDQGATFDDFSISVKLQEENDQRQQTQVMGFYQVFFQIRQAAPMMPWVRWMNVLRDMAEAWGMQDASDEWAIPEFFGAFGQPPQFPPSAMLGPGPMAQQHGQRYLPAMGWPQALAPGNPGHSGNPGQPRFGSPQNAMGAASAPASTQRPAGIAGAA